MIQTTAVSRGVYVAGVLCGRGLAVLAAVFVALSAAALVVPFAPHGGSFVATNGGLDSPLLYGRFCAVTALYAVVSVAVAGVVSVAVADRSRPPPRRLPPSSFSSPVSTSQSPPA